MADEHRRMSAGRRTTLGLTWPHKDKRLVYSYDDQGQPYPHFTELCRPEPRVLIDVGPYGTEEGKEWHEESNLLIRGDNLLVLKTLCERYARKVKLIYIDPPFGWYDSVPHPGGRPTARGGYTASYMETLLMTESGIEVLSKLPRTLQVLPG